MVHRTLLSLVQAPIKGLTRTPLAKLIPRCLNNRALLAKLQLLLDPRLLAKLQLMPTPKLVLQWVARALTLLGNQQVELVPLEQRPRGKSPGAIKQERSRSARLHGRSHLVL